MKKNKEILNTLEAADFLRAHAESIRRLARKGEIPAFKIGKDWRFRRESLLNWAETHHIRQKQPCVLVIDDEQGIRDLIRRFLEAGGYQIKLASNGVEGLRLLENNSIDLILLDLKMPEMDGPEFLRRCRENNPNLPVIVITGYPDSDLMAEAMHYGPITLLAKPVEREHLMNAVHTVFNGTYETVSMKASF